MSQNVSTCGERIRPHFRLLQNRQSRTCLLCTVSFYLYIFCTWQSHLIAIHFQPHVTILLPYIPRVYESPKKHKYEYLPFTWKLLQLPHEFDFMMFWLPLINASLEFNHWQGLYLGVFYLFLIVIPVTKLYEIKLNLWLYNICTLCNCKKNIIMYPTNFEWELWK